MIMAKAKLKILMKLEENSNDIRLASSHMLFLYMKYTVLLQTLKKKKIMYLVYQRASAVK